MSLFNIDFAQLEQRLLEKQDDKLVRPFLIDGKTITGRTPTEPETQWEPKHEQR